MARDNDKRLVGLGAIPSSPRAGHSTTAREPVYLERDVRAVLIPSGMSTVLPGGGLVTIMQELGGDYTVMTSWGTMVRISHEDADALGRDLPAAAAPDEATPAGPVSEERVWDELGKIYDPEIPVSIVELGLIYGCQITALEDGRSRVDVRMTLTAPGCGMGQVLKSDVERRVGSLPGVAEVHVDLVFDPPWDRSMMSEAAQLELGLF